MAGLMRGVAWLIPYCARHHPSHLKDNGCRGSACSPVSGQEGRRPQTARVITRCNLKSNGYPAHHPPLPGPINPVCATREHVRPPALQAPLVTCAMREHGGLAWPPRPPHPSPAEAAFPTGFTARKPEETQLKKGVGCPTPFGT